MPDEGSRTTARKKILLPGGDTIYVPVITKISFVDPYDRYQETQHDLDNSDQSSRVIHADNVHPVPVDKDGVPTEDVPSQDASQELFVERIDTWHAVDPYEAYQQTSLTLDNTTGNDVLPPHFSQHERTHIYRYHKDPAAPDDNGVWVDSELIDEFIVLDPYERYQEKHYTLDNPTNMEFRGGDLSGQASTDDPDLTIGDGSGEGTETNPVRLDPFQNIVNYSGGITTFFMSVIAVCNTSTAGPDVHFEFVVNSGVADTDPPPLGLKPGTSGTDAFLGAYLSHIGITAQSRGHFQPATGSSQPPVNGPGPPVSVSPANLNFSPWQMAGVEYNTPDNSFITGTFPDAPPLDYQLGNGIDTSVVGPPLLINGQPKAGFADTFDATLSHSGAAFKAAPVMWSGPTPSDGTTATNTWWTYTGALFDVVARTGGTLTLTVLPTPFEFNGGTWRAIGLSTRINSHHSDGEIQVYCVPVLP